MQEVMRDAKGFLIFFYKGFGFLFLSFLSQTQLFQWVLMSLVCPPLIHMPASPSPKSPSLYFFPHWFCGLFSSFFSLYFLPRNVIYHSLSLPPSMFFQPKVLWNFYSSCRGGGCLETTDSDNIISSSPPLPQLGRSPVRKVGLMFLPC